MIQGFTHVLDPIPIVAVFLGFLVLALLAHESGFRVGRFWRRRFPREAEGPTDQLVASILALQAFLLAVTMGMASGHFHTRREVVRDEANAIGRAYLRAGYLPEPWRTNIRGLLREYVPLRIVDPGRTTVDAIPRSERIHADLWTQVEGLVRETPGTATLSLFVASINEVIDLHTTRMTAAIYARVPETIVFFLVFGAFLSIAVVGYGTGLSRQRGVVGTVALIVSLTAVITLVIDLDRPRNGLLQVSQQPLIDLQESLASP